MNNYNKSLIYFSLNLSEQDTYALSTRMGVSRTANLGRYLGHKLLHQGRAGDVYALLLQRIKDKLGGWKAKCLTRAGRLTLAKTVVNSMATFEMQTTKLLAGVHKELDKTMRYCVWGSSPD